MKKIVFAAIVCALVTSCKSNEGVGEFTVQAEVKNIDNQQVYLEQLFFNENAPQVIDTANVVNGKFSINGKAAEQGLYRLRFEKQQMGYIFINDNPKIKFTADANIKTIEGANFDSKANKAFQSFLAAFNAKQLAINGIGTAMDSLSKIKNGDSAFIAKRTQYETEIEAAKTFVIQAIDTIDNPVVCMFALGYSRGIESKRLEAVVPKLEKRFPTHQGIKGIIAEYNNMVAEASKPKPTPQNGGEPQYNLNSIAVGTQAPSISMADTTGKMISLASFEGKYLLLDFWASWCMPCRGENPNVVANYNTYKAKNFTVLGVSLDDDATAWKKAIVKDKLSFTQISELKGWRCTAAQTYGFDAIPFNVLIDPTGKIIAKDLRGEILGAKLAEVLK
jgi:peroxiredoxin